MADYEEGIRKGREQMLEWLKGHPKLQKHLPVPRKFRRNAKKNKRLD